MKVYEDECVGCADVGLPCMGQSCPNRHVLHIYCDKCGDEGDIYEFEGQELCISCIEGLLEKVS